MADVVQKAISANDIVQGAAVVAADKFGNYQNVDPQNTDAISTDAVESKYTERFN
jgi:hypothetical protein